MGATVNADETELKLTYVKKVLWLPDDTNSDTTRRLLSMVSGCSNNKEQIRIPQLHNALLLLIVVLFFKAKADCFYFVYNLELHKDEKKSFNL